MLLLLPLLPAFFVLANSNEVDWENKLLTVFKSNARFKSKWCSKEEFDDTTLKAVYACQLISVLDSVKMKEVHDSCRTVVFGGRGISLRYVRRQLCDSADLRKFYVKCLMDLHWKQQPEIMESITRASQKESLKRILPMAMERQACLNDALNLKTYDNNDDNDVDHTMVDKSGDLAFLFATAFRKKTS